MFLEVGSEGTVGGGGTSPEAEGAESCFHPSSAGISLLLPQPWVSFPTVFTHVNVSEIPANTLRV